MMCVCVWVGVVWCEFGIGLTARVLKLRFFLLNFFFGPYIEIDGCVAICRLNKPTQIDTSTLLGVAE